MGFCLFSPIFWFCGFSILYSPKKPPTQTKSTVCTNNFGTVCTNSYGCQACRRGFVKFLVKFALDFDLKFEISRCEKSGEIFGGGPFYLPGKHEKFRGEFRGKFRSKFRRKFQKLRFRFRDFFGNFVQQKGGANKLPLPFPFTISRKQAERVCANCLCKLV